MALAALDLDGDGLSDLATADDTGGSIWLYRNHGDGTLDAPFRISFTGHLDSLRVTDVATSDFDGDGNDDLAVAIPRDGIRFGNNRVEVLFNNGDGEFRARSTLAAGYTPLNLVAADMDRDGRSDVAVVDVSVSTVQVFLNDSAGRFHAPPPWSAGRSGVEIVAGDLDGDGGHDLLVSGYAGDEILFLSNDTRLPRSEDRDHDGVPDECQSTPFHRGDSNADGDLDVSDGLCVLEYLFADGRRPPCLQAADANGDGRLDCSDAIHVLGYLFLGTVVAPVDPGPPPLPCGVGPDSSPGAQLTCEFYEACE